MVTADSISPSRGNSHAGNRQVNGTDDLDNRLDLIVLAIRARCFASDQRREMCLAVTGLSACFFQVNRSGDVAWPSAAFQFEGPQLRKGFENHTRNELSTWQLVGSRIESDSASGWSLPLTGFPGCWVQMPPLETSKKSKTATPPEADGAPGLPWNRKRLAVAARRSRIHTVDAAVGSLLSI